MFEQLARLNPFRTAPVAPPGRPASRQLPAELMKKVRRIEIATNRLVDQGVAGDYHSVFKGRGMEFSEVRPYQPGDDVRSIDWNVTARLGSPYVKQYVEERDLTVFLAIDVSGSLHFGSRAILKREMAAEIGALLAFAAVRNQDRVGAALISDFVRSACPKALKAAAARHDLVVIEIVDPRDLEIPAVGPVVLRDAETGDTALVHGRRLAREHRRQRENERRELRQLLRGLGVDHLELRTDKPYLNNLLAFFEQRRRRLSR
jgi:uncharacterized protein (DUF58 family)